MMMVAPAVLLLLLSVMVIQPVRATPVPFTMIKKNAEWIDVTNSASSSRADSASAVRSQNNVKCFAFCLGVSTAGIAKVMLTDSAISKGSMDMDLMIYYVENIQQNSEQDMLMDIEQDLMTR